MTWLLCVRVSAGSAWHTRFLGWIQCRGQTNNYSGPPGAACICFRYWRPQSPQRLNRTSGLSLVSLNADSTGDQEQTRTGGNTGRWPTSQHQSAATFEYSRAAEIPSPGGRRTGAHMLCLRGVVRLPKLPISKINVRSSLSDEGAVRRSRAMIFSRCEISGPNSHVESNAIVGNDFLLSKIVIYALDGCK